jgi:hypothetical protein
MTIALVPVLLAVVSNLATDTVAVPRAGVPWVWAATAVLVVTAVRIEARRHQQGSQPFGAPVELGEATSRLAVAVRRQWQREEVRRHVRTPSPLRVRWHVVQPTLMDHWENITRVPAGTPAGPADLAGGLDQVLETYRRIPSGRLVVLGRGGSGKTVLALRFVLDLLERREPGEPVPVIFSLGSWNPSTTSLGDWLTERLIRDHPGLGAPDPDGASLAAVMVTNGHILPVLDGFDEIAEGLHCNALDGLNELTGPLLMTSRPNEYAEAVAATDAVLADAAAIELDDLTLKDLIDYLPRTARVLAADGGTTTVWDPVLQHARDHQHDWAVVNLVAALSTPLMVGMARTVYSDDPDRNPAALLDTNRFGTANALENHLLGAFVPAAYRHSPLDRLAHPGLRRHEFRRYDPNRAQHWLGYLANHLNRLDTRDLAWWELGKTIHRIPLVIMGIPAALLTMLGPTLQLLTITITAFALAGFQADISSEFLTGVGEGLNPALLLLAVPYASLFTFADRDQFQVQFRPSRISRRGSPTAALGYGIAIGVSLGIMSWWQAGFSHGFQVGLVSGFAGGLVFGMLGKFETPSDITATVSPAALLAMDRSRVVFQVLACWLVLQLVFVLGTTVGAGRGYGIALGLSGGFVTVSVVARSVWIRWLAYARFGLPLTGRLPWAVMAFLDDAHQRGVLRQAGGVYQFRHARLQDHLARSYQARRKED